MDKYIYIYIPILKDTLVYVVPFNNNTSNHIIVLLLLIIYPMGISIKNIIRIK